MLSLSRETMGVLSIAALWVTALLVAGAAWQDLRDVRGRWRRARSALRGRVESVEGEGALATWWVEQRGRALDSKGEAIAFHDRAFHSSVAAGTVRVGERLYRVTGPGEVWASPGARARACLEADDPATFGAAYAHATRAAGFVREVRVSLRVGDEVFVLGETVGDSIVRATGAGNGPLVVSGFDASPELARHAGAIVAFIVGELSACAWVTDVALSTPHFGARSIVGALLCLGFYLGVTPLAVALREKVRRPSEAYVRGSWRRSVPS